MPTRASRSDGGGPRSRSRTSSSLVAPLVEYRDDVGVDDGRRAARLVRETRSECVVRIGAEELDRDVAVELLVARAPHLAGPALIDALNQAIPLRKLSRRFGYAAPHPLLASHTVVGP